MTEHYLTVTQGAKSIGETTIWENVDIAMERGEMVALTGPSGSGKTTLLNCLGALPDITSGRIRIGSESLTEMSAGARRRFRRDHLGYLFQNYALVETDTVQENLLDPLRCLPRGQRPGRAEMEEALATVGMAGRSVERVYRLSGGEQQRVALAGVLLKRPDVVLADEPTGALDAQNAQMVLATLRTICEAGGLVVIATHNQDVMDGCDRVIDISGFRPTA